MEDKMAAGAFERARNYGWDAPPALNRVPRALRVRNAEGPGDEVARPFN